MLGIDHLDNIDFFFKKNNKYFNTNTIRGEKILKKLTMVYIQNGHNIIFNGLKRKQIILL